jgi:hypothetical protein
MKFLFYLLAMTFSYLSYGQNSIPNYEIGYFVDINKQLINGYSDFNYEPEKALHVSYVIGDNFTDGYYFDKKGTKINGLLKYSMQNRDLKFKLKTDDDEKSIIADECNGYVIGVDSFSVVKNVDIIGMFGDSPSKKGEFAEYMGKVDDISFYKFLALGTQGSYVKYVVRVNKSSDYLTFPSGSGKFKKMASEIFGSDAVLKAAIEKGKYEVNDVPSLIKIFKYRKLFERNQNILYNTSWDETDSTKESSYYAKIESVKDSVFHVSYFFNNDVKIHEGDFTSFFPHKKRDIFTFYYPNGTIRKKVIFTNNKPKNAIEYFLNQNIHRMSKELFTENVRIYDQVNNEEGKSILDQKGNGKEVVFDAVEGREITYEYIGNKLENIYYLDNNGEKIYQFCQKSAKLTDFKDLQKSITDNFKYPVESIEKYNHGYVLVKCIVEPTGLVSDVKIIKGVDVACNSILDFLSCMKSKPFWKPGKVDGVTVRQEIIVPIDFSITGFSVYKSHYNNFWQADHMMFQQQMNQQWMNQQMSQIPKVGF